MAESSDLDVRIRIENEAEGVIDDLKKSLEEVTKVVEKTTEAAKELGETTGAERLAEEVDKISESLRALAGADFESTSNELVKLANEAGVTSVEFENFLDLVIEKFDEMSQEALAANDIASTVDFSNAAESLKELASGADFSKLVAQLQGVEETGVAAGEATLKVAEGLDQISGAEKIAKDIDAAAEAMAGLADADVQSVTDALIMLSDEAGVTADNFGDFVTTVAVRLRTMAEEALAAGDSVKNLQFEEAAQSLEKFSASANFGDLITQLKELEGAGTKAGDAAGDLVDGLSQATGSDRFAAGVDAAAESLAGLAGTDLEGVTVSLTTLAKEAGVTATEFDTFVSQVSTKLREMSQEALAAGDSVKNLQFEEAAKNLDRFIATADFAPIWSQLKEVEEASGSAEIKIEALAKGLVEATGAAGLADTVDRAVESLKNLENTDAQSVIDTLTQLGSTAGVTADQFGEFVNSVATQLRTLSEDATTAGDSVKSLKFEEAAKSLDTFAGSADFTNLISQLRSVEEAGTGAATAAVKVAEGFDTATGAEKLTADIDKVIESADGLKGLDLQSVINQMTQMGDEAGVTSAKFVEFASGVLAKFRELAEEASVAGDSVNKLKFEEIAVGLEAFIGSADFSSLISELQKVEEAEAKAGDATAKLIEEFNKSSGSEEKLTASVENIAAALLKLGEMETGGEVINGVIEMAAKAGIAADDISTFFGQIIGKLREFSREMILAGKGDIGEGLTKAASRISDSYGSVPFDDYINKFNQLKKAQEELATEGGAEKLAGDIEKIGASADSLSDVEFDTIIDGLVKLADEAGATASEFGQFVSLIARELQDMSVQAGEAGDAVKAVDFAEAAEGLKKFTESADFGTLVEQLKQVETEAEKVARIDEEFQPVTDALVEMAESARATAGTFEEFDTAIKQFDELADELRKVAGETENVDEATAKFLADMAMGLDRAQERAKELGDTLKTLAPEDTVSALEQAVSKVSAARAEPGAADREKEELEDLKKEVEGIQKAFDPAVAAQEKFAEGSGILERALNAGVISAANMQQGMGRLNTQLAVSQAAQSNTALQTVLNAQAAGQAARAAGQLTASMRAASLATGGVGVAAAATTASMGGLASSFAAVSALMPPQIRLLLSLAGVLLLIKTGIQEAAQTQQLNLALESLAINGKVASDVLKQAVTNMEAIGIAGSAAREAVIQLATSEIDVANATGLAVAARNLAIARGEQEEDVLGRLSFAVTNLNQRALRNMGIVVKLEDVYKAYEVQTGRVAENLSMAEKRQALMNEVLAQAGKFAGIAEKGSETYTVQLNKQQKEFRQAMEGAFTDALPGMIAVLKLTTEIIGAFGKFLGMLVQVAGFFGGGILVTGLTAFFKILKFVFEGAGLFFEDLGLSIELSWKKTMNSIGIVTDKEMEKITKEIEEKRKKMGEDFIARAQGKDTTAPPVPIAPTTPEPDVGEAVQRLIGTGAKEGKAALQDLGDAMKDFAGPREFIKNMTMMRDAIRGAFGKIDSFEDFNKFLNDVGKFMGRDTEQFRIFKREADFTQNAKMLAKMNEEIKGYLDATEKIAGLQKVWTDTLKQSLSTEEAISKFVAEIEGNQTALIALETQGRARAANLASAEHNEEIFRINERYAEQKKNAELFSKDEAEANKKIALAEKARIEATTVQTKVYYDSLKKQQADYLQQYVDSTKKIIELEQTKSQNVRNGEQLIRDIRRRGMNEQAAAEDTQQELVERTAALKEAQGRGDQVRVKEEIAAIKSLAGSFADVQGKGDTSARRDAINFIKQANAAQKQLDEQAIATEQHRRNELLTTLQQMSQMVDQVQSQLTGLVAQQITATLRVIVDPASINEALTSVQRTVRDTEATFRAQADLPLVEKSIRDAVTKISGITFPVQPEPAAIAVIPTIITEKLKTVEGTFPVKPEPTSVTQSIATIDTAVSTAKITFPVQPEPASVTAAVTSINTAVSAAPIPVKVEPEPAAVTATAVAVRNAVSSTVASIKIQPDPISVENAVSLIQKAIEAAQAAFRVIVDAVSVENLVAAIKSAVSAAQGVLKIAVDSLSVTAAVAAIENAISDATAKFKVAVDAASLDAAIQEVSVKIQGITFGIQPDPESVSQIATVIRSATNAVTGMFNVQIDAASIATTLNQVKSAIESVVVSFKVQVAPDSVTAAVDYIKTTLGTLVAEFRVQPDPASVQNAVTAVKDSINAVVAAFKVQVDSASIESAVVSIRNVVESAVGMFKVQVDPASIAAAVASVRSALGALTAEFRVQFELTSVESAITAIKNSVVATIAAFKVQVDSASVESAITTIKNSISATIAVFKVQVDPASIESAITAIKNSITAAFKVEVDSTSVESAIASIRSSVESAVMTFKVQVDSVSVSAAVAYVKTSIESLTAMFRVQPEPSSVENAVTVIQNSVAATAAAFKVHPDPASVDSAVTVIRNSISAAVAEFKVQVDSVSVEGAVEIIKSVVGSTVAIFKVVVDPASIVEAIKAIKDAIKDMVATFKVEVAPESLVSIVEQIQSALSAAKFSVDVQANTSGGGGGSGGATAEFATGGSVRGFSPTSTSDNILGWLTANEFVQPVKAVQYYGTQFMEDIRNLRFPKFAQGGTVNREIRDSLFFLNQKTGNAFSEDFRSGKMADSFNPANRMELSLTLDHKKAGSVFGSRETVTELTRFLKKVGAQ